MAYAIPSIDSRSSTKTRRTPAATRPAARRGLLSRIFDAVFESREQEAQRVVGSYLKRTGYRFTDSVEREVNQHYFSGWNARR